MPSNPISRVSHLLSDVSKPEHFAELFNLTYGELRSIAGGCFRHERPEHTLTPTALVHESFIRLNSTGPRAYESRRHYFGIAAHTMRQILIDYARKRTADKRGGHQEKDALDEGIAAAQDPTFGPDFLAIHEALDALEQVDPALSRLVELRVFGGFTSEEIGSIVGLGESTVRAHWRSARAWLQDFMLNTTP